jgi:hypothetical protein
MKIIAVWMFGLGISFSVFGQTATPQQQWHLQRAQERQQHHQQQQIRQQSNRDQGQQRQLENNREVAERQMREFAESERRRGQAIPAPIGQGCNPRVQTC